MAKNGIGKIRYLCAALIKERINKYKIIEIIIVRNILYFSLLINLYFLKVVIKKINEKKQNIIKLL